MMIQAWQYLKSHCGVFALCSFGIAIAISSILTVGFLSDALKGQVRAELDDLNTGLVTLEIKDPYKIPSDWMDSPIARRMVKELCPYQSRIVTIADKEYRVIRTDEHYGSLFSLSFSHGRFFGKGENGVTAGFDAAKLQREGEIWLDGIPYKITGVIEKGSADLSGLYDDCLFVPGSSGTASFYFLKLAAGYSLDDLRTYLGLYDAGITLNDQKELEETAELILSLIKKVLTSIASISLCVSLFGLSAMSYLSGRGRMREWGIRQSVGAGWQEIFGQLLAESAAVSFAGCMGGILFSSLLSAVFAAALEVPYEADWLLAITVSLVTVLAGSFAGALPALKAASRPAGESLHQV